MLPPRSCTHLPAHHRRAIRTAERPRRARIELSVADFRSRQDNHQDLEVLRRCSKARYARPQPRNDALDRVCRETGSTEYAVCSVNYARTVGHSHIRCSSSFAHAHQVELDVAVGNPVAAIGVEAEAGVARFPALGGVPATAKIHWRAPIESTQLPAAAGREVPVARQPSMAECTAGMCTTTTRC